MTAVDATRLNKRWNCRLTTIGRNSGLPRTVTVWFVLDGDRIYLTGGKDVPQWCRNIRANGVVSVQVDGVTFRGRARIADSKRETDQVIARFLDKYLLARIARPFGGYTRSVPVVVDIEETRS